MGRLRLPIRANIVDRAVTFLNPEAGMRRLSARLTLYGAGGYHGARTDRAALKEWNPRLDSANSAAIPDLKALRSRSRDLVRNDPIAGGAINTAVTNVIGTGLQPIPQPDATYLGLTQEQADEWAAQAERVWWAWAGSTSCHYGDQLDFAGVQALVFRSELESGDVLPIRRFVDRQSELFGTRVQIIEADRISTPDGKSANARIIDGVEVDTTGAHIAYWVQNEHPGELKAGPRTWRRVPAKSGRGERMARLLYEVLRPDQTRGIPYLAPVIETLKQLGRYSDAELMAAVVGGMIAYTLETDDGESLPFFTDDEVGEVDGNGREQMKIDYGAVLGLAKGEKLNMHSPNRPNQAFDPFMLAMLRRVGAGLGIPFELLVMHFTKSYSASRAAWMLAWQTFSTRRSFVAWNFCQPYYELVMTEAVARGYISAPGFLRDPMTRQAWLACDWRGPAQGQLDPSKEAEAAAKRYGLRISSLAELTAEATGGDYRANLRQIAHEKKMMEQLGLEPNIEVMAERVVTESSSVQKREDPDDDDGDPDDDEVPE